MSKAFLQSFFDELKAFSNPFTFPWSRMVLPMLTLLGAWGGFPDAPDVFKKLAEWKFFQYFFLWVLVMQGGASADPGLSFIAVVLFILLTELLKKYDNKEKFGDMYGNKDVVMSDED